MDVAALYREHGPAILAACRRATGDDRTAAQLAPRVFAKVQRDPGDLAEVTRVAHELAAKLPGPRLVRDPLPPTGDEIARAGVRFEREVYRRTLALVERDQRPPRILRWLFVFAPLWVVVWFGAMNVLGKKHGSGQIELFAGDTRLWGGERVHRGDRLNAFIDPGSYRYVTVYVGPRVVQHIDHASGVRVQLDKPLVVEESPFRMRATFSDSPKGSPLHLASIELKVE